MDKFSIKDENSDDRSKRVHIYGLRSSTEAGVLDCVFVLILDIDIILAVHLYRKKLWEK